MHSLVSSGKTPNKSLQPTKPFVTPHAGHGPRQPPLQLKPTLGL